MTREPVLWAGFLAAAIVGCAEEIRMTPAGLQAEALPRVDREHGACAGETGAAYGLCHAYCEAIRCYESGAPDIPCAEIRTSYLAARPEAKEMPCDNTLGASSCRGSGGEPYASYVSEGRTVSLWKTARCALLSTCENFCKQRGLSWWRPRSQEDAQRLVDFAYGLDNYFTWVNVHGVLTETGPRTGSYPMFGSIGGYSVSMKDPWCVSGSSSGWAAFRWWGCSFCDPETDGPNVACCGESRDHLYDWFACEGG